LQELIKKRNIRVKELDESLAGELESMLLSTKGIRGVDYKEDNVHVEYDLRLTKLKDIHRELLNAGYQVQRNWGTKMIYYAEKAEYNTR